LSYSVVMGNAARQSGLVSSTPVVIYHAGVATRLANTAHGFNPSTDKLGYTAPSTFGVINVGAGYGTAITSLTLTTETLASAAIGEPVLIDDGSGTNTWRWAQVVSDGSSALAPGGQVVPSSAVAYVPIGDNNLSMPPIGTAMTLQGTASDGSTYLQASAALGYAIVACGAATTAGAAAGKLAIVSVPGAGLQVVQL
jgi:hypothetical protein